MTTSIDRNNKNHICVIFHHSKTQKHTCNNDKFKFNYALQISRLVSLLIRPSPALYVVRCLAKQSAAALSHSQVLRSHEPDPSEQTIP